MKGQDPKSSSEMWKKLILIGEKQGSIQLADLAFELGLSEDDTLVFLRQLFPCGQGAEIYTQDNVCMVDLSADSIEYMLPLSPSEWVKLNQVFSEMNPSEIFKSPELMSLSKKLNETGPMRTVIELLSQLERWDEQLSEDHHKFVSILDDACEQKSLMNVECGPKKYDVFPCKVTHLEGKLSLIAEDAQDNCLITIPIKEVSAISKRESTSMPKVSFFEVEEFIAAVRSMNEKEMRLILKIYDPTSVNLFPQHHFLGKPCMISNPVGDLIWAAYVEPCEDLFEWLISLGAHAEILDPSNFKDEYLLYCEEKLRKIA